ncbi:OsmC family protein [Paenibacillus sp. SI8]|uniref:OsmC family protein n=1 Tax=unclassified Paenibacillus TaxID=185978 RepID=UPI00346752A1
MSEHSFTLKAIWSGGLHGVGYMQSGSMSSSISIPSPLGGPGVGTNPEEMLLGAAATCYLITLGALLERLGVMQAELRSEILVSSKPSMKVNKVIHRPCISVAAHTSGEQLDKIRKCAYRAEQTCMISKAMRGNVEVEVEPEIRFIDAFGNGMNKDR